MPDGPGLELIRGEIERELPGSVIATSFAHGQPALIVDAGQNLAVLRWLRDTPGQRYTFLASVHAADYLPQSPRFAVHYELINRERPERLRVKALLADPAGDGPASPAGGVVGGTIPEEASAPAGDGGSPTATGPAGDLLPSLASCTDLFPTANAQEREIYDFFGINFTGHPDMTRIMLPEDYVGWPLRRDFPVGGEPVTFTYNEARYG